MTTHTPIVSVIMPTYNAAQYLGEAIESVLAQTFADWELLVVDDGSTDDTHAVLARYGDPRIRVFALPQNSGRGSARNTALRQVRGRYVAICDSDDLSLPSRFERHVAFLDANPDIDIVSGQFRLFGGGIGPGKTISYPEDAAAIAARYARGLMGVVHGASMVRARCFDRHGLYREDLSRAEDFELFYRFSQVCRFRTLPDVVLEYRSGLLPSLRVWAETRRCHRYALYLADARRCRASAVTFEEFSRRWNTKLAIHTWELLRFFRYAVRVYVFSNPALR